MLISQTEYYVPSSIFRRSYALSVGFKMKSLKKVSSCVKTKTNSNSAVNLAWMLKEENIHFYLFDESLFSDICTLKHATIELIDCKNLGKRSETANALFQ